MSYLGSHSSAQTDDPYRGDTGEVSGIYRPADGIDALVRPKSTATFVAPGSATDGRFGLFRWQMAPRAGGPSAHFHRTFSESFYVLDGTVRLYNGEKWIDATAGDFLFVPEGGVHAFRNDSDAPADMLILFAPGSPRENYFQELAEVADKGLTLSPEEWKDLYARHDQFMVDG
ncbi:cupin domain-containing protein [Actinokineospora fastidiosa]|uniref:Cupin n=1 Tax=Actinokineospora fastidiosa TaxID=1816 RepID=A0A918GTI2_9PSEU|nr:cupin domain-containing protein [Actinokineospora fastidiosa]GGS60450.1 cupin [Actinokineospora fastidiosa]